MPRRPTAGAVPMTKSARAAARSAAADHAPPVPMWCAVGLSLAMIGSAAFNGVGVLCATVLVAVVIVALTRLHASAAGAATTSELLGSVLGPVSARLPGWCSLRRTPPLVWARRCRWGCSRWAWRAWTRKPS